MTHNTFEQARKRRGAVSAEDYTELVSDLIEQDGAARIGTIAKALGISHVTALRTTSRLEQEGYLFRAKDRTVQLTTKGKRTATFAREKHQLLLRFLHLIGVPDSVAKVDVEGMEHHISPTTYRALVTLCDQLSASFSRDGKQSGLR